MLKNKDFAGKQVITKFGMINFDEKGLSTDLTQEQEKAFKNVKGYKILDENLKSEDEKTVEEKEEVEEVEEEEETSEDETEERYTKSQLEDLTVSEIEDLAEELGIELEDGLKSDKINQVLKKQ